MRLSDYPMNASIAVSDMERAEEFYEGKLGLVATKDGADGSKIYAPAARCRSWCTRPGPRREGDRDARDLVRRRRRAHVDALAANGVTFEHYDGVLESGFDYGTDEKGISPPRRRRPDRLVQDPDGNTLRSRETAEPGAPCLRVRAAVEDSCTAPRVGTTVVHPSRGAANASE